MCCMRLTGNTGCKHDAKNYHLRRIAQLCSAISSQLRHVSTIEKKIIKQQYLLQMSLQYGKLRPTNGWNWVVSFGHPSEFQRVLRLGFVTAATSLTGGHPNFARYLAMSCVVTLYMYILGGSCPLTDFWHVQNLLCIQVLRSPVLAVSLHGTPAVDVSQTLGHAPRNWVRELLQRCHLYSPGRPSRWASAHILVPYQVQK